MAPGVTVAEPMVLFTGTPTNSRRMAAGVRYGVARTRISPQPCATT